MKYKHKNLDVGL